MLQVTRQQLGLLIREVKMGGNPKVKKCSLDPARPKAIYCHIQPCPIRGAGRGTNLGFERHHPGRGTHHPGC